MSKSGGRIQSAKIVLIMLGITLWSLSILVRLVQLQIVQHEAYAQSARKKQQVTRSVSAPRGIIYDSHMDELATSVTVPTVLATPKIIDNKPEASRKLAAILDIDPEKLLKKMSDPARKEYLRIKRRIDPAAETSIKALGIEGVYFVDESMRVYPNRELASHALGFVNMEGNGGAGLELQYDRELKGEDGLFSFDVDARRQSFRVNVEKPPVQGCSLALSIDKSIQFIADRELAAAVKNAQAKAGTAIIMESDTGRILALSNYPTFNCNTYNTYTAGQRRNRAVTDMFEPGSTFKVVVATAALEAGLIRPDDVIDCENGSITLAGHVFRDHKQYGKLTFNEILEHSSNVGAVKLGLRLAQQRLYEAIRHFGFGSRTGIDLPGEIAGSVRDTKDWSGLSIASISFGQEVGVTSIQILTAINAIANGGYLVRPSVVDRIIDENHNTIRENRPIRTQIMSHRTAEAVTEAFEGAVVRGTGKHAALEGYRAAGKTGTAQKIVNGRYEKGVYVSSFIGFAPLPNPRITILVQLDEPKNKYYGGDVCAPYFKNIAQEVLLQLRVPPDTNLSLPEYTPAIADTGTEDFLPDAIPAQPVTASNTDPLSADQPDVIAVQIKSARIVLPDFRGMSKRKVLNRCIDLGIHLQSKGSGVAIYQSPLPGTEIPVGSTCSVTFTKKSVGDHVATLEPRSAVQRANLQLSSGNAP
ncbi:MAG: PASTA domain-containing protein [Acidobacteria bacterium]|nr:PASTA domain-containing protein [Acidobacteriota bacterium]